MAKKESNKKHYKRLRASGVRKSVARQLSQLPGHARGGKRPPKPMREAVQRLEATITELRGHARRGDRQASARKAARTRRANSKGRSSAARKGARKRARA